MSGHVFLLLLRAARSLVGPTNGFTFTRYISPYCKLRTFPTFIGRNKGLLSELHKHHSIGALRRSNDTTNTRFTLTNTRPRANAATWVRRTVGIWVFCHMLRFAHDCHFTLACRTAVRATFTRPNEHTVTVAVGHEATRQNERKSSFARNGFDKFL